MHHKIQSNSMKCIVLLFFIAFFIIGFSSVKDYGVHWDEFYSHDFGNRWYKYIYNLILEDAPLGPIDDEAQHDVIHGPIVEVLLAFLADVLNIKDSRNLIFLRHHVTWLIFYIGVIFFYLLCKSHFNNRKWALIGCLFLILHPRIFSHSFYDSVDIPFLSFYIISLYTLIHYRKVRTTGSACVHALSCAILVDIRSIGAIIPFLTYIIFAGHLIETHSHKIMTKKQIKHLALYTVLFVFFIILFWPYLWRNPILCMIEVIKQTPRILWGGTVLYMGDDIYATNLPWHYIPVWIAITTPIWYTFCFIWGALIILKKILMDRFSYIKNIDNEVLFLAAFSLPILLVIVFHSILYDSWRHLFFIYPAFLMISLIGMKSMYDAIHDYHHGISKGILNAILTLITAYSLLAALFFMVKYHPFQNVYFNVLAGKDMKHVKKNFELDYWGLSYRKALEYIIENDTDKTIKIYDELFFGPLINNIKILPIKDRRRIKIVKTPEEAKYVLTNYRWRKEGYAYLNEYYTIRVGNGKIMCVYKLSD